jgi:hypothetical protein
MLNANTRCDEKYFSHSCFLLSKLVELIMIKVLVRGGAYAQTTCIVYEYGRL